PERGRAMHGFLLLLHLAGVVVWLGGMIFAAVRLHPSLGSLEGRARAELASATLGRFLRRVPVRILLLWASGIAMLSAFQAQALPLGWHLMIGIGVVMTLVYLWIVLGLFRPARQALARGDLPAVAPRLGRIRRLVVLNLALGALAVAGVL